MEEFVQTVKDLLENHQWQELKALLAPKNPNDLAHIFAEFDPSDRALLFRLLEKQEAVEVFESLPLEEQQELLGSFKQEQLREIVEHMSPDDRAYLLEELPAKVAKRLLGLLTPEERAATALLLGYGENTAGRSMTPEYIDLKSFVTVGQALEKIRRVGVDKETIYYSYVTDEQRRLLGIVSIRQLVLADPQTPITDIMEQDIIFAHTDDDQEEVALKMQKYDLLAIPVVDREDRLVGIVTHDDVMDIIQEEVTEDIYRLGAMEVPEQSYFKSRLLTVVSSRLLWVLPMILIENFNGYIINQKAEILKILVSLAAFVPLITSTGGNMGSQTSTVFVRGLALKEVSARNALSLLIREVGIGLLMGLLLAIFATAMVQWIAGNTWVTLIVGLSLILNATMTTLLGASLPLVFSRLGFDPAIASGPLISTMIDVLGIVIYFQLAGFVLSWTLVPS
ncbi:MAG: magnesium transporter [Syntrophobacterales bacterium]|jgi:magnesium transporter